MPSPPPARKDSRSPSRRRGRDAKPELPPTPPPPARRGARTQEGREQQREIEADRQQEGLRRARKPPRDRP
eukprot:1081283-Alexandrium_andersonii.AAC.1